MALVATDVGARRGPRSKRPTAVREPAHLATTWCPTWSAHRSPPTSRGRSAGSRASTAWLPSAPGSRRSAAATRSWAPSTRPTSGWRSPCPCSRGRWPRWGRARVAVAQRAAGRYRLGDTIPMRFQGGVQRLRVVAVFGSSAALPGSYLVTHGTLVKGGVAPMDSLLFANVDPAANRTRSAARSRRSSPTCPPSRSRTPASTPRSRRTRSTSSCTSSTRCSGSPW